MKHDRLSHLDRIRAIAVLGVIVFHASVGEHLWAAGRATVFLFQGNHGVELFFVISGFCLAYPTLEKLQERQAPFRFDWIGFAAKRIVRILPPYLVTLALLVTLSTIPAWFAPLVTEHVSAPAFSALQTLKEALLLDGGPLHNSSFWTLSIELRWYAIFPLALALFVWSPRALAVVGLTLWILHYESSATMMDTLVLPAFFLGILAADAHIRRPQWIRFAPYACAVSFCAALLFAPYTRFPIWQIAAFAFVVWASQSERLQSVLRWPPLVFVGVASYSIYLIHQPVIVWAESRGLPPVAAGAAGLLAGVAFWAIVERTLLLPRVRTTMVNAVRKPIAALEHFVRPSAAGAQGAQEPRVSPQVA